MPELTFSRTAPGQNPAHPLCMYCGDPAAHASKLRVAHPLTDVPSGGGGTDITPTPGGDDPVSAVIGLVLLPFVLWDVVKAVGSWRGRNGAERAASKKPPPPLDPPDTLVTITTCGRHRHFTRRFWLAGLAGFAALVVLWVGAVQAVRADTPAAAGLLSAAALLTVAGPVALSGWYIVAGPVIVDRVTRDTVVLDRVRTAYFTAAGIEP